MLGRTWRVVLINPRRVGGVSEAIVSFVQSRKNGEICALSFLQLVFLCHGLAQTLHSVLFVAVLEISLLNGVSLGVGCQWLGMPSVLYLGPATPTLAGILTDASVLRTALEEGVRPMCNCRQLLLAEPRWPVVTFEGQQHIAASQGHVPWPEHLQHLARWPASLCLPPRYEDIVCAVRHGFRRLRDRCRMHVQDVCTDNANSCVCFQALGPVEPGFESSRDLGASW